ncbi:hypothetical protein [Streptomyces sp. GbtcB6]|uniref:hypothetical protein n=1 Tax=Streptomyces sp. GbtcB6 TaxID=2824751 RepID=UPI001C30BEAC|nr:hypothetical protein [Streptomyces sp. GbtcB6]
MAPRISGPETKELNNLVDRLPEQVSDWTPEQRDQYTAQSDRAMNEQNGTCR